MRSLIRRRQVGRAVTERDPLLVLRAYSKSQDTLASILSQRLQCGVGSVTSPRFTTSDVTNAEAQCLEERQVKFASPPGTPLVSRTRRALAKSSPFSSPAS